MAGQINWKEFCHHLIREHLAPHAIDGGNCSYSYLGMERQGPCTEGRGCTPGTCFLKAISIVQNKFREGE